jgi:hypothetical protein
MPEALPHESIHAQRKLLAKAHLFACHSLHKAGVAAYLQHGDVSGRFLRKCVLEFHRLVLARAHPWVGTGVVEELLSK